MFFVSLSFALNGHICQTSYAHDFFVNNDATLVTLTEQIKAETHLINTNLLSGNNVSANVHAKNAALLMNELEDNMTEVSEITQIYVDGKRNSTSVALVIANIVDEILRKYGIAFDIGYDLTNMSSMHNMTMSSMSMSDGSLSSSNSMDMMTTSTSNSSSNQVIHLNMSTMGDNDLLLVDTHDYETAKVLAENVNRIFSDDLRPQSPVSETMNLDKLEKSFNQLRDAIEKKASPGALMEIVHIEIHPTLQKVYDLKLL